MIAEAKMGNGDRAYEYYRQINPASKNDVIDIFESEPYCYPQNILGDEHPQFGLGRNARAHLRGLMLPEHNGFGRVLTLMD